MISAHQILDRALIFVRQGLELVVGFWVFFWRHFEKSHCTHSTAALSYATLLALVPLLALSLAVFSAFPAFHEISDKLLNLLFENLVPAAQETIQEAIRSFVDKAKALTGPGIVFLVITALMLMITIEKSLNEIWNAPPYRAIHRRVLVYWAVLTLGPLLIGAGIAITSQLIAMAHLTEEREIAGLGLMKLVPFLLEWLAFTLLYQVVPNTRVKMQLAVCGGMLSAALFELAKMGFAFYITRFPTYEAIYGALAAVPIFLVWLYLSWLVTLVGALFTLCLHGFRYSARVQENREPEYNLGLVCAVLDRIWLGQQQGNLLDEDALARRVPEVTPVELDRILIVLNSLGWIARDEEGRFLLRCDPHQATLLDLYSSHPFFLSSVDAVHPALKPLLVTIDDAIKRTLNITLAELFAAEGS